MSNDDKSGNDIKIYYLSEQNRERLLMHLSLFLYAEAMLLIFIPSGGV